MVLKTCRIKFCTRAAAKGGTMCGPHKSREKDNRGLYKKYKPVEWLCRDEKEDYTTEIPQRAELKELSELDKIDMK